MMKTTNITLLCTALAAALPAFAQAADMQGMDMKGMDMHGAHASAPQAKPKVAPTMAMPASAPAPAVATPMVAKPMAGMKMPAAHPTSRQRTADAYSDGYTLTTGPYIPAGVKPPRLADQMNFGSVLVDRLETAHSNDAGNWTAYDVQAWWGRDFNRVWLKAEGQVSRGRARDTRTELLWDHALASFWDTQLGVRHDAGGGPDRNWLAFGVQGIAPYWFDVEATGYLGDQGRSALRLNASYELLLTQRIVLQPQIEANLYGRDDTARDVGAGLSDVTAGVRLRYEFTRQFAPYIGVEWGGSFGRTADMARAAGNPTRTTDVVAGVHLWF